jgi:hypothetical protein
MAHSPDYLARQWVLDDAELAAICPEWLVCRKKVPKPVQLGSRKHGSRIGDLIDSIESRGRGSVMHRRRDLHNESIVSERGTQGGTEVSGLKASSDFELLNVGRWS